MIPIRDHNPTRSRPIVVYAIVALNVLVWLYEVSLMYGPDGEYALADHIYLARSLEDFSHCPPAGSSKPSQVQSDPSLEASPPRPEK